MRIVLAAALAALICTPAFADDVPRFQVEAAWPKPLPNNWILGQVAGIATDPRGSPANDAAKRGARIQWLHQISA